eukprot:6183582-Pleurochrysis_carterae.AAC.9
MHRRYVKQFAQMGSAAPSIAAHQLAVGELAGVVDDCEGVRRGLGPCEHHLVDVALRRGDGRARGDRGRPRSEAASHAVGHSAQERRAREEHLLSVLGALLLPRVEVAAGEDGAREVGRGGGSGRVGGARWVAKQVAPFAESQWVHGAIAVAAKDGHGDWQWVHWRGRLAGGADVRLAHREVGGGFSSKSLKQVMRACAC